VLNLQDRLETRLASQQKELIARHRSILEDEFQQVRDPDAYALMMNNFDAGMQRLVKKYYGEQFHREVHQTFALLDNFPAADAPNSGDLPLEDQVVGHLLELLQIKFATSDQLARSEGALP
jgi:hypothetical protein